TQAPLLEASATRPDPDRGARGVANVAPGDARITIGDGWDRAYRVADDAATLRAALAAYDPGAGPLAIDTESDRLQARTAELVGVSFGWRAGEAWYVPVGHRSGRNLPLAALREVLGPHLADERIPKAGQHLAFDLHLLGRAGLPVCGPLRDTMIAAYLCEPEARAGLDLLARTLLGHEMVPITRLIGGRREQISMAEVPIAQAAPYACEDVDAVVRLWPRLDAELDARQMGGLFRELEMPLVPILVAMEAAGIALDPDVLEALATDLRAELVAREAEIQQLAGEPFNVNSPKQLQKILFQTLGLRPRRKTKTGYSTRQEVLEELATEHPLPRALLDYRQLAKLLNTYIDSLPRLRDPQSGRLHAHFHQTATATGRLSSSQPNLQNIPIRTDRGREIRKAFIAPRGFRLLSADYSQIELRLLAHLSQDAALCEAFAAGADIHCSTAARIFGIASSRVDAAMRARAKTVNFGVLYGMGAQRLARELRIPVKKAARFIEDYYAKLPGVKRYIDENVAAARRRGYAETLFGRRRPLPDLSASHPRDRAAAERMAINTPVQGSAADLIKRAMIRLDARLRKAHPRARLLLQVHDELIFEVPAGDVAAVTEAVRAEMIAAATLRVPLLVATGAGRTWYAAHA
ncbi:MAG: DNA polymerase I, partial [Candidatus Eisenbacteria bacterium]|nr:DNA polymerase I [Candidatus Eisenbacteria bacterium]